jgi:mono/diheme cytochrome c family protein
MRNILRLSAGLVGSIVAIGCRAELPGGRIVEDDPPVVAATRPPPLSGGTLLVTRDEANAVASDPERDRVLIVDLTSASVREVALEPGDEPGRGVEDEDGHVHVALRRSGDLVTIDVSSATVTGRRQVCGAPRGVALDEGSIHVACADGQLVTLPADPAAPETRRIFVEPDLRDVLVREGGLDVTTFRQAELLRLGSDGEVIERLRHPSEQSVSGKKHEARVGYRTLPMPDGSAMMVHHMHVSTPIEVPARPEENEESDTAGAYGGADCADRLTVPAVSLIGPPGVDDTRRMGLRLNGGIDLATTSDGSRFAVVDALTRSLLEVGSEQLGDAVLCNPEDASTPSFLPHATPVAVAYAGEDVVVQTREPPTITVVRLGVIERIIELGGESRADTGFDLFYGLGEVPPSSGLACASCHPEGRDDGHTWSFSDVGLRRTQSLAGTISHTAPFHWGGDFDDLEELVEEVFTKRMAGPRQSSARVDALFGWIESLPPVRASSSATPEALDHGKELFESEEVGCASCHGGTALTNNDTVSVGRESALQVPSLIGIGTRGPFMHDGCASTLQDRFDPECGGDSHGDTANLDAQSLQDLIDYTSTL